MGLVSLSVSVSVSVCVSVCVCCVCVVIHCRDRMGKRKRGKKTKGMSLAQLKKKFKPTPRPGSSSSLLSSSTILAASMSGGSSGRTGSGLLLYPKASSILVVGDGNMSFSRALAMGWVQAKAGRTLTATSYDSRDELYAKYVGMDDVFSGLDAADTSNPHAVQVLHSIDATQLEAEENAAWIASRGPFDVVIFNFPHVGGSTAGVDLVALHKAFLAAFFSSASSSAVLAKGGSIQVALRTSEFYAAWDIVAVAEAAGLELLAPPSPFLPDLFPGYRNERTASGNRARAAPEIVDAASVYSFRVPQNIERIDILPDYDNAAFSVSDSSDQGDDGSDDDDDDDDDDGRSGGGYSDDQESDEQ